MVRLFGHLLSVRWEFCLLTAYCPQPNRTTTPMGNPTPVLLLSTWTTPSVLVLLLPQLLAPTRTLPRTRRSPPARPLHQAHEHKKTGRAPRRWLRPPPRYRLHLQRNKTSSPCCASSLHLSALLPLMFLVNRAPRWSSVPSLCLRLWPQARAEPDNPSHQSESGALTWGCRTVWQGPASGCRGHRADQSSPKETEFTQSLRC